MDVVADDVLQRGLKQVRGAVVSFGAISRRGIHQCIHLIANLQDAVLDDAGMQQTDRPDARCGYPC